MYPLHLLTLHPPFPRENKVFVVMSFDPQFDARWENVIVPAIGLISISGKQLEACRVDTRIVSDSILTEIVSNISNHLLVFADITSLGEIDGKPVRNGNVMYEVGLAHAVRLPEEVILFRSDSAPLLFDVANVRVNIYDPDRNPNVAREAVVSAILNTLKECNARRLHSVQNAVNSLDIASIKLILSTDLFINGSMKSPTMKTFGNVLSASGRVSAISRLLDLGVLQVFLSEITSETIAEVQNKCIEDFWQYRLTPFGEAIRLECANRFQAAIDSTGIQINLA